MAQATVIAYHAVGDCPSADDPYNLFVSPDAFRRQMAFLARRRNVVPLDVLLADELPRKRPTVAITFDDGYRSVLTEAGPVLRSYGFPATVFVPTAFVGRRSEWLPPSRCPLEIMSPNELRESDGLGIAVESHGHAHIDFARAGSADAEADLRTSIELLTEILGRRPRYLAYPFGPSSPEARAAAEACGFEAAFSIDALDEGPCARERVQITPLDGPVAYALKTSGRYLAWRRSALVSRAYALIRPLRRKR
jgi:peptidoglycan/xylan/chitin deacetylase (PgdA/CDA1 family)